MSGLSIKPKKEATGSNPLLKMMLRQFLPTIREKLQNIDPFLSDTLAAVALQPGEEYAAYMLAMNGDVAMVLTATFDAENKLVRQVNAQKASDFVETILSQI